MFKELVPNNIYKPGDRLRVSGKNIRGLLLDSIINIISCNLTYDPNILAFNMNGEINIDPGFKKSPYLIYKILIERVGKSGKKRLEIADINVPLLAIDKDSDYFSKLNPKGVFDTLSLKTHEFMYWIIARILFLSKLENINAPGKNINTHVYNAIKIEKAIRYKHTSRIISLLTETTKLETIPDYLKSDTVKEEIILELREQESSLSKEKVYYSALLLGKFKLSLEFYKSNNHEIYNTEGAKQFEALINNNLLVTQFILFGWNSSTKICLPKDPVMRDVFLYIMSNVS